MNDIRLEYDLQLLETIRKGETKSLCARKFVIENDNPVWTTLVRYGASIRVEHSGPQYQIAHRISTYRKDEDTLELRLATGRHLLKWREHTFEVMIESFDNREEATIHMDTDAACEAFTDFIRHAREFSRRKGRNDADNLIVKVMRGGNWKTVSSYPKRPLSSLITGDDTVKDLLTDMKRFVDSECEYVKFGMPFKRNYLIIGPPGSGKSSLLSLAASELDLDVCYISVTAGMSEKELCTAIGALNNNSMLVLEDVDVLCTVANGGNTGGQTALAVLTNVLDGTLHRHKLITVLTSANPEALESVLTRHGRIDHTSRLGPLTEKQVYGMVSATFTDHDSDDCKLTAQRIWTTLDRLGPTSSTVLAHFLFEHRHKHPKDIDDDLCHELSHGTHTKHINDAHQHNSGVMYM